MMNQNSPIIQEMLRNTPMSQGNFYPWMNPQQFYYGNTPVMESAYMQTPIYNGYYNQQPMYYQQTPFPNQYGVNLGQQQLPYADPFASGYYNPYFRPGMGMPQPPNGYYYNPFDPYQQQYGYGYYQPYFNDPAMRAVYENAVFNGVTMQDQMRNDQTISRILTMTVGKNLGLSDEQINRNLELFETKTNNDQNGNGLTSIYDLYKVDKIPKVKVYIGGELAYSNEKSRYNQSNRPSYVTAERDFAINQYNTEVMRNNTIMYWNTIHNNAIEREADNMDMYDFFDKVAPKISIALDEQRLRDFRYSQVQRMYNRDNFRSMLDMNNNSYLDVFGGKKAERDKEIQSLVSSSIQIDPSTRSITLTAPQFVRDRLREMGNEEQSFRPNSTKDRLEELRANFLEATRANSRREKMIHGDKI